MTPNKESIVLSNARVRLVENVNEKTAPITIKLTEHALRFWQLIALSSPKKETAAALIGPRPNHQANKKLLILINDIIPGKHMKHTGVSVTLTPDTFRYWECELMKRYPDQTACILGWAHTHPKISIFFSPDDRIVHSAAFSAFWQVGLVSDPHQPINTARFFGWSNTNKEIVDCNFHWPDIEISDCE